MNDKLDSTVEESETPDRELLVPSDSLYKPLLGGSLAVLMAGGLAVAGGMAELIQGNQPGLFTTAHALGIAALAPLVLVLRTYLYLGQACQSGAVPKSALGLFVALVLLQLHDLVSLPVLDVGIRIAIWAIIALGAMALLGLPFISTFNPPGVVDKQKPRSTKKEDENEEEEAIPAGAKTGILGGLGVAVFVVLKLFGKGLLAKFIILRGIGKLIRNVNLNGEGLVEIGLLLATGAYLIWFALAKIGLRRRLGGVAILAGAVELIIVAVTAGMVIGFLTALQHGVPDKNLEEWIESLIVTGMVADVCWASVTAWLFLRVRWRFRTDEEWYGAGEG
jgi:hypothetical protein